MALKLSELRATNQLGAGSGIWTYQASSSDDPTSAGYFNNAWKTLTVGDRIFVTLFTNFDKSDEAYSSALELIVTANNGTTVTVEEV